MNKKFYKEEVVMACDWFSDLYTNKRLPSHDCISKWFNEYYVESFPVRNAYVTTFGFPLLTKEVIAEVTSAINSLVHMGSDAPTVLELCCGSGYLGSILKENGLNVICTDNNAWKNDDPVHGHGNFFQKPYTEIEEIDALEAIEKYKDKADVIILSWPEYESELAARVLEKCLEYNISMIYIGERYGGCTGDDEFFDIMEERCNERFISDSYIPFPGIHDNIYLVTKKPELVK